jgi:hypothetical protein
VVRGSPALSTITGRTSISRSAQRDNANPNCCVWPPPLGGETQQLEGRELDGREIALANLRLGSGARSLDETI